MKKKKKKNVEPLAFVVLSGNQEEDVDDIDNDDQETKPLTDNDFVATPPVLAPLSYLYATILF